MVLAWLGNRGAVLAWRRQLHTPATFLERHGVCATITTCNRTRTSMLATAATAATATPVTTATTATTAATTATATIQRIRGSEAG